MIISLSRKFVFVHIPKCAGTSVEAAFAPFLTANDILLGPTAAGIRGQQFLGPALGLSMHSTATRIRDFMGSEAWESFFKFALIRAPVARLRSLYRFNLGRLEKLTPEEREKYKAEGTLPDRPPYAYGIVHAAVTAASFSEFAMQPTTWRSRATRPLSHWLCDGDGNLLVDHVAKVETLDRDWQVIRKRVGIDVELGMWNRSTVDLGWTLTQTAATTARAKLADDYERFGYGLDDHAARST